MDKCSKNARFQNSSLQLSDRVEEVLDGHAQIHQPLQDVILRLKHGDVLHGAALSGPTVPPPSNKDAQNILRG